MLRKTALRFLIVLIPFAAVACASTTVKKNPGPHDRGIRYYRPKPYLKLAPAATNSDEMVTISLEYLPDFAEEYSIHVRAGVGKNKTGIELEDGWNLTKIDIDVDSKFSENLKAAADLIGAIKPVGKTSEGAAKNVVKATNVPLGYYESVFGNDGCGVKRLYGWRYVGFMPYAQCPQTMNGVECHDCNGTALYGLVFENGVMTFKPVTQIGSGDSKRAVVGDNGNATPASAETIAVIKDIVARILKADYGYIVDPADVSVLTDGENAYAVKIKADSVTTSGMMAKKQTDAAGLDKLLSSQLSTAVTNGIGNASTVKAKMAAK